ncbi:MAG: TonB-dependent receptor [Candidatus Sphingomonas phytovorans]|nr:TonB-dependent receptor [Sphingomonas sp.]WEK01158.1 MAG: TonB-dependent receptor [Sphingomonas sp.]
MRIFAALNAGVCLFALAPSAWAQDRAKESQERAAGAEEPSSTAEADIVVTGSRVIRDGRDAPTPVTITSVEQMQLTPSNIPEALNKLPQFAGSTTSVGAGNGAGSGRSNIFTGNYINLRSFGAIRTLVLQDGHRVPPTAINGQVDTNTIPQMLVERVEVVTGGASAVYGSDAVTGVVNFVLDKDFKGLKANFQTGISSRGDAPSWKAGIAAGFDITERGHFEFSAEHYYNKGLESQADRSFSADVPAYTGAGTAAKPYVLTHNARLSNTALGGLATSGPFAGQQFVGSGILAPFNSGTATGTSNVASGGDGGYFGGTLVNSLETNQLFGRFDYDITDNANFYVEATYADASTSPHNLNERVGSYTIFSGNAFLPANAQALLTSANAPSFTLGRVNSDLAAAAVTRQKTTVFRVTTGVDGKVGAFDWGVYYTHGEAKVTSVTENNINYPNFYAALDAVRDPNGNAVCRITLTNPTSPLAAGCAPINMFGSNNQSAAALDYIYGDTSWQAISKMDDVGGSISGNLFNNWAGAVTASINAEYRRQSLDQTTSDDPNFLPAGIYTGVRGVSAASLPPLWAYLTEPPRSGENEVWEVGSEVLFPLLADIPLVRKLDFNGAVRYTHYANSGSVVTYKLGLTYEPFDGLRFRAAKSRDIRAPTLADLSPNVGQSFTRIVDPLTGQTGNVNVQTSGNPDLVPEVARTYTAGVVYQPSWLPRLTLSFDYYNIRIDNAISSLAGSNAAVLQQCAASGGTSALCGLIERPLPYSNTTAANFPTLTRTQSLNIAEAYTEGFDVEASYGFGLGGISAAIPGQVNLRLLYSYQPILKTRSYTDAVLDNDAGQVGLSKHRVAGFVGYKAGPFAIDVQMRYSSKQLRQETVGVVYADPYLPSAFYTDLNLAYDVRFGGNDNMQLFLNIGNLFDRDPRVSPALLRTSSPGTASPTVAGDDMIGRYFTTGVRFKF